jgi:hypothetical protein
VQYSVCDPATGGCELLGRSASTLAEAEGVDVGYVGQAALTSAFE